MNRDTAARAIDTFLRALGRDPDHEPALVGTGARVAAAFADELLVGYGVDVDELLSQNVFAGKTELVVVRDLPIATICPHHLMPSMGVATVAFAPEDHIVGVGTVARVVDAFARRLALQEEIGERVVAALQKHLAPRWTACRIALTHACMSAGAAVRTAPASRRSLSPAGTSTKPSSTERSGLRVEETLKLVGSLARASLEGGAMVRLVYPPFHVLVALVNGLPYAIEDACNHAGASLSEGEREGACVSCPMHAYVFELATGRLVRPRGFCDDQRCFVARFDGDDVVVLDPGALTLVGL